MIFDTLATLIGVPLLAGAVLDDKIENSNAAKRRKEAEWVYNDWANLAYDYELKYRIRDEYFANRNAVVNKVFGILSSLGLPFDKHRDMFIKKIQGVDICTFVLMAVEGKTLHMPLIEYLEPDGAELLCAIYRWGYEEELPRHGVKAPGFLISVWDQNYLNYKKVTVSATAIHDRRAKDLRKM